MKTPTPLRLLRIIRGLTINEVGSAVGLGYEQMRRVEKAGTKNAKTAEKLVNFFGEDAIGELEILYPERYKKGSI